LKECLRLRDEFAQFPSASRATGFIAKLPEQIERRKVLRAGDGE